MTVLSARKAFIAAAIIFSTAAHGQSVQQSGVVSRNHVAIWNTSGVIQDGGSAADSPLTSLGVTNSGGAGFCVSSDRQIAAGRNQLCFGAATAGPAVISLQNYGTAPAETLQFVINGVTYSFPGSLANITVGTTPVVSGTNGLCLYVAGGVVGQQACTLSAITSLTGDVTAAGPGVSAATLAASGVTPGTYGSSTATPVLTVDAKGRITAATTTPAGVTVGSTVVTSGTTNGLLYDNGSVLGNLGTLSSGVLVTSAGGVPSISITLPSGLAIPSPTFTGTETFPDSATWTSSGISKVAALSAGSATIPSAGNINISGQYQVSGSQIAASNLSDGNTGTGSIVHAAAPAISGIWTGSPTFSGNIVFSGQAIHSGTSAPASAGGNTVVMGTIAAPTLSNTGQAFLYNTVVNGAILEGNGSTNDVSIFNKSGALVAGVPTGTTKLNLPSLSAGTCSSGLGLDAGNNTVLISCPGAAGSIQVGTTSVTSGTNNNILTTGTGILANIAVIPAANGGAGTINGALKANGSGLVAQAATTDLSDVTGPTSWTPQDNSGASLTFAGVSANYTKIGNMIFAYTQITYPATANGSNASIKGLPIAAPNVLYAEQCSVSFTNVATANVRAAVIPNTLTINLYTTSGAQVTNAQMSSGQLNLMCIYPVS